MSTRVSTPTVVVFSVLVLAVFVGGGTIHGSIPVLHTWWHDIGRDLR